MDGVIFVLMWTCDCNLQLKLRFDSKKPKRYDRSVTIKTCLKTLALLKWSQIISWSELIFDKSDSVRSRTKKYKNLFRMLN